MDELEDAKQLAKVVFNKISRSPALCDVGLKKKGYSENEGVKVTRREPAPIISIVRSVVRQQGWENEFIKAKIINNWNFIAGEQLAQHTKAQSIIDSTLKVAVNSGVWGTSLNLHKSDIIRNIENAFDTGIVDDIQVVMLNENIINSRSKSYSFLRRRNS
ncbi:MAG: DUF721 domain-containing protein [Candidatus Ancillula sp.]|jgi:hypothetical protein|nr:DUF721 domain-containing protein [Candidatus Ancillula sp.]